MKTNESKKEVQYVAFSTQKGGAGKTTLTVLIYPEPFGNIQRGY